MVDSKELFYGRDIIPRLKWTFDKDGMLKSFDNINNDGIDIKEVENTVTIGEERTGSSRSQLIDNTIIIKNILNLFKAEKYTIDDIESIITNFSIHCSENDKVYDFNVIYYPHKKIICDYADKSKVLAKDVELKDYYKEVNKLCEEFLKTKGVSFNQVTFKTTDFQTYIDTLNERMSYKEVLKMIEKKYEIVSKEKISEKTQITNFSQIKKDKDMGKKFVYTLKVSYRDPDNYYRWNTLSESTNPNSVETIGIFEDEDEARLAFKKFLEDYTGDDYAEVTLDKSDNIYDEFEEYKKSKIEEKGTFNGIEEDFEDKIAGELLYEDVVFDVAEPKSESEEIDENTIIIAWEWVRYIGYARKFKSINTAGELGIKTRYDLNTGNQDRVGRELLGDFSKETTKEELLKDISDWKWTNPDFMEECVSDFYSSHNFSISDFSDEDTLTYYF